MQHVARLSIHCPLQDFVKPFHWQKLQSKRVVMRIDAHQHLRQVVGEGCRYFVKWVKQMDHALHLQKVRRRQQQL
jgi:hypothetical protein